MSENRRSLLRLSNRHGLEFHYYIIFNNFSVPIKAALGYVEVHNSQNIRFGCGGALISAYFVLTAAHCAKDKRAPVVVRLGKVRKAKINYYD